MQSAPHSYRLPQHPITHIVQLSDLHIKQPGSLAYGRVDTAFALREAVKAVNHLRQTPHAVVITGDLTDFGRAEEYLHLQQLLEPLKMPVYLLPGNHDDVNTLRQVFSDHAYLQAPDCRYTLEIFDIRLIALNTVVAQQSHGELLEDQLAWLEKLLTQYAHQPTLIAMHHPPFQTLIGHMDAVGLLKGAAALESLVVRHPQVQRIVCGHLHRCISARFGGTIASTAAAPCHQVSLDLSPDAPSQFEIEPAGFSIHAWNGQCLVSHSAHIGVWPGPYAFYDDQGLIDS